MQALHPIDIHIAHRLHAARTLRGYSQAALGEAIGLNGKDIRAYEDGQRPMPVSVLCDLADVFEVSLFDFFQNLDAFRFSLQSKLNIEVDDLEFLEAWTMIPENQTKDILRRLVHQIAGMKK